ncbi:MAG: shikimate dehydrogenase [Pseudomonadota bacterium]
MSIKLAVIGYPIKQSKSPIIHGYWMEKHGIEGTHEAVQIDLDQFERGIQKLIDDDYRGFNVTVPHKERIIPLCTEIDDTAKAIGAVNTVTIEDGKLYGSNTDAYGFIQNLKQQCDQIDRSKKAIVLGAGGAARAVVYALQHDGFENIVLLNRTRERAEVIVNDIGGTVDNWDQRSAILEEAGLVVNTTSLGMIGQPELELDVSALPHEAIVYDIVYKPLMTDLLNNAKDNKNQIVTGIGMLLHQAVPAFEQWTGIQPEINDELERLVLA